MKNKCTFPLTDQERQITPMPGEVAPENARRMAIHFAAVARSRANAANKATPRGPSESSAKKK